MPPPGTIDDWAFCLFCSVVDTARRVHAPALHHVRINKKSHRLASVGGFLQDPFPEYSQGGATRAIFD